MTTAWSTWRTPVRHNDFSNWTWNRTSGRRAAAGRGRGPESFPNLDALYLGVIDDYRYAEAFAADDFARQVMSGEKP